MKSTAKLNHAPIRNQSSSASNNTDAEFPQITIVANLLQLGSKSSSQTHTPHLQVSKCVFL